MIKVLKKSKKIIMSKNGKFIATYFDKVVTLYDSSTYKEILNVDNKSIVSQIVFSHNSKMLAIKTLIGFITVYRLDTLEKIAMFKTDEKLNPQIYGMCFSKDNKEIINLVYNDMNLGYISIYDIQTKNEIRYFEGNKSAFESIKYVPERKCYVVTGYDKLNLKKTNKYFYAFVDLENENIKKVFLKRKMKKIIYSYELNKTYSLGIGIDKNKIFKFNNWIFNIGGEINDINISHDGKYLLTMNDKYIVMFDTQNFNIIKKFEMDRVNYAGFSYEDTRLLMASDVESIIYEL